MILLIISHIVRLADIGVDERGAPQYQRFKMASCDLESPASYGGKNIQDDEVRRVLMNRSTPWRMASENDRLLILGQSVPMTRRRWSASIDGRLSRH